MSPEAKTPTAPSKQTLRRQLRAQRRDLDPQRDRSADADAIAATAGALVDALTLSPSGNGQDPTSGGELCVAIYRSLPSEPPTHGIAAMLHARRLKVIVPETLPDLDLDWHELLSDGSEGPRLGAGGIAAAQLILAPALAVDHTGTRLGQGGGCYDRALTRRRNGALIVAIVNDQEYVRSVLPREAHDQRVDAVITPGAGLCQIQGPGSVT